MQSDRVDGPVHSETYALPYAAPTIAVDHNGIKLHPSIGILQTATSSETKEDIRNLSPPSDTRLPSHRLSREEALPARSPVPILELSGHGQETNDSSPQETTGFTGRSRRSSVSHHEPTPPQRWVINETFPINGWRMKTRWSTITNTNPSIDIVIVYVYDSTACAELKDQDADLDIFHCHGANHLRTSGSLPFKAYQLPPIDPGKQTHQALLSAIASRSGRLRVGERPTKPQRQHARPTNWIQDPSMLEAHIPNCRIVTFGFDICCAPYGTQAAIAAAGQLNSALLEIRRKHQPPIVYLGHTFGGLIALWALASEPKAPLAATSLLRNTVGLLLFSCPLKHSNQHSQKVGNIFGANASHQVSSIMCSRDALSSLRGKLGDRTYSMMSATNASVQGLHTRDKSSAIMSMHFPIYQILTQDEFGESSMYSLVDSLDISAQVVFLENDYPHAMAFATPNDKNFQMITMLVKIVLRQRPNQQLLLAAATGGRDEVEALIKEGVNTNVADQS